MQNKPARLPYGTYNKATRHLYRREYMRQYMRDRRERARRGQPLGRIASRYDEKNDPEKKRPGPKPMPIPPRIEPATPSARPTARSHPSPLAPPPIKRHDGPRVGLHVVPGQAQQYAKLDFHQMRCYGNTRHFDIYEPIVAEQCLKALADAGLPTNDGFNRGKVRYMAKEVGRIVGGRLSDPQLGQVMRELHRRRATCLPISHISEALKIAYGYAQTRWGHCAPPDNSS